MSDIVERLRAMHDPTVGGAKLGAQVYVDAADEIERLRAAAVWHCEACGTVTRNGECDCTKLETGTRRLVPYDYRATLNAEIERLRVENWQLKQACGYSIPADKETINNPFKCGTCDAKHIEVTELRALNAELVAALRYAREQVDRNAHGRIMGLAKIDTALAKAGGKE